MEKQEKEEGEVEQEVESEKEENAQTTMRMSMDGMRVKRQMRSALSQCEDVNTSDDATTDCVQCAQCCMVSSSACVASFTQLFTLRSPLLGMCLSLYTLLRSLLSYIFVREFLVQDVCNRYIHDKILDSILAEIHTANE